MIFRHDYNSKNVLQFLDTVSEVCDGSLLEIMVSGKQTGGGTGTVSTSVHSYLINTYKSPTFCDHCGGLLLGLVRQGLHCEYCGLNCHKKCAYNIPNFCSYAIASPAEVLQKHDSTMSRDSVNNGTPTGSHLDIPGGNKEHTRIRSPSRSSTSIRPAIIDEIMTSRVKVPHTFIIKSYNKVKNV